MGVTASWSGPLRFGDWRLLSNDGFAAGAVSLGRLAQAFLGQAAAFEIDGERAVEAFVDVDSSASIGRRTFGRRRDVDDVLANPHRVVVEDGAAVLEAEELVKAAALRPLDPSCLRLLSADYKAPVVSGQEASEDLVGLLAIGRPGQAELARESVLEGSP